MFTSMMQPLPPEVPPVGGGPPLIAHPPPPYCYAKFGTRGRANLNPDGPVLDMTYGVLSGEHLLSDASGPRCWDTSLGEDDGFWVYTRCIKTTPFPDPWVDTFTYPGFWVKRRYSTQRKCQVAILQQSGHTEPPSYVAIARNIGGTSNFDEGAVSESADNAIGKPGYEEVVSFYHDQTTGGTPYPNAIGNDGLRCYLSADPSNTTTPFCTTISADQSLYSEPSTYGVEFLRSMTSGGTVSTYSDWYLVEVACGNNYALSYNDMVTLLQNGLIATFGLWG